MKSFIVGWTLMLSSAAIMACDLTAARKVRFMIEEMASVREKDDKVFVYWRADWDSANRSQREGLLRAFADADSCWNARSRDISFFRNAKLVGRATPKGGVRLLD